MPQEKTLQFGSLIKTLSEIIQKSFYFESLANFQIKQIAFKVHLLKQFNLPEIYLL